MNYRTREDMPSPLYSIGDIVAEKAVSAKKMVPMRIVSIIRPEPDRRGRIFDSQGYEYVLETALPEDGDFFLNGKKFPEGLLQPFSMIVADYMLGGIYSRIEDIKELACSP